MLERSEMCRNLDSMRVSRELQNSVSSATDRNCEPGNDFIVWQEKGHMAENG